MSNDIQNYVIKKGRPHGHRYGKTVKCIPPTTENWLRKRYNYSVNNDTSTEDKHETNHINKYNDMNMNSRKMHIT